MYKSGSFVADYISPTTDEQVQPNGVDLTLEAVFEQSTPGALGASGKTIGERVECPVVDGDSSGSSDANADSDSSSDSSLRSEGAADATSPSKSASKANAESTTATNSADRYDLETGAYVVRYAERIRIPEGHVGFLYPRSSLLRNSCMLNTAVWDAGYEGRGEGLLQVHHPIALERGARIAQLVLAEADHEASYAGSYQGENL